MKHKTKENFSFAAFQQINNCQIRKKRTREERPKKAEETKGDASTFCKGESTREFFFFESDQTGDGDGVAISELQGAKKIIKKKKRTE